MKRVAVILAIAACVVASPGVEAAAQGAERPLLHSLFQDHAVVQRGQPLHVWGWTGPNERVMARLDNGPPRVTRADRTGAWRMSLGTLEAGGPHTITAIAGGRTQVVTDVLAGDVFLCSGQSNMEFPTRLATNSTALLREAPNPQIRLFQVSRRLSATPQHAYDAANRWMVDEPAAAGDFSAVCYLFGRAVQRTQHVPVGLIHASWGGTPIEAWMSEAALRGAGRGDEVELAAAHARDPQAADRRFAQGMQQWRHDRDPGVAGQWNAPDLDDRDWATVSPEGFWEDAGEQQLAHLDGIVWFRTDFTLSAAQASLGGRLELGPADDADVTYVNGQRVGGEDVWDAPRAYARRRRRVLGRRRGEAVASFRWQQDFSRRAVALSHRRAAERDRPAAPSSLGWIERILDAVQRHDRASAGLRHERRALVSGRNQRRRTASV
ncbi:MAG: sialate O-acetylesterase [Alphaproteobacteria bacterium]|nr:MAG: sialate O-acetylesterase [Alphaproteobacteria bacterium]